jgi:plastocyanin
MCSPSFLSPNCVLLPYKALASLLQILRRQCVNAQNFFEGTDIMNGIRSLFLLVTIAGLIEFGGCSSSTNPYGSSSGNNSGNTIKTTPNTVVLSNMAFGPTTLTVAKGTTVTWQNNDGIAHTATSDTGAWDSGNIPAGGSKSVTFATAGTYQYHCTVHPMMTATIVVQ